MIVVKLMGGMGNQMFQYAFGRNLAHKHKTKLKLDLSFFLYEKPKVVRTYDLDIFNVQDDFASREDVFRLSKRSSNVRVDKVLNRIAGFKRSYIREANFNFSEAVMNSPDDVYLEGHWQTEKYFADIETLIREDFTFKEEMGADATKLIEKIENSNSICVNVRRGDFVTDSFHGSYGVDYFQRAEAIVKEKSTDHTFFVFSDEIEWCEENLRFDAPTVFVSHKYAGRKFQDYLRLMAACKHFIIPNSSFAWWAVWFNQNADRTVIAPKVWYNYPGYNTKDLIPASWLRI